MAIVKMKKMLLIGLEDEKAAVLSAIQETGSVEIEDITDLSEDSLKEIRKADTDLLAAQTEEKLNEVKFALEFLGRYSNEKKGMFSTKPTVTVSELNKTMENQASLIAVADNCRVLEDKLTALRSRKARLEGTINQMLPWETLDADLDSISTTAATKAILGTIKKEKAEAFVQQLEQIENEIHLEVISIGKEDAYCLVLFHKDQEGAALELLKQYEFNRTSFSGFKDKPKEIINRSKKEIQAIEEEEGLLTKSIESLVSNIDMLRILFDGLSIELERYRAAERIVHTGKAYLLKGWIPQRTEKRLTEKLTKITDALQLIFEDPSEEDTVPVILDNPTLVQPFEVVTSLYSTPSPKGIDPNAFMAPFYFILFGVMMGDAGYGIIMAIAGTILTRKMKLKGMAKKLGYLMALCGISTFVWGVLSGSWFGDIGEKVAPLLGFKTAVIWFSPMEEPLLMLGFCFALGLIHVFFGMGIKAYMSIRDGYVWDAVFDQGLWFVLIVGLLLLVTPAANVGKIVAIVGAVGLVLTQGRSKKNIISKFFSGLLSLYNITGIFSDVLSYSRLFALGLATGIIGMVFNILAGMLASSWLTFIFAVAIMLVGHTFNILINVLGSFVHASRLQYIEFFGKFFEGGGHAFTPLTYKTKYIDLIN